MPYFRSHVNTGDPLGLKNVLGVDDVTAFRLPAVSSLDLRAEKMFKFRRVNAALDLDVFNIGNNATILGRQYDMRATSYNQVQEIMDPRVARVGVRLNF